MAGLSFKHIYKVYPNGVKAVNDFNMEVADKEFIVFVGPSGCGKSTTLRMIAGLEDISAGELKIGDLTVNDVEPKDRDIAMVFQNYALYPHMTVYENIAFGLRLRKLPKEEIHRRVTEAAQILGITEYLARKPKEMSGGQRQRVSLGRAIVREPKVMLLDEPLSNLDAKLRTQMRAEISKLHAKLNTTFVYVTHDQVEAMTMGTRIVVMKGGFVQQIDTPKNLYRYPCNKFVASFIGTPQMNFFEATLKKAGEKITVEFSYSDEKISVPSELFCKVRPDYLNGEKKVVFGLRAEDITFAKKQDFPSVKVKISHTEELGSETLVYGDINMGGDGYTESATRIIVKTADGESFSAGREMRAYFDVSHAHLFDGETQESILPRIPAYNIVGCTVKNGVLQVLGQKIILPPAMACKDGAGELFIPCDAFVSGKDLQGETILTEQIGGETLLNVKVEEKRLFILQKEGIFPEKIGEKLQFSIDWKRVELTVNGEKTVRSMPTEVSMRGKLCKEKRNKRINFYLQIEGAKIPASDEIVQKLTSALGVRGALAKPLRFACSPYGFSVEKEGIFATVTGVRDYGREQFLLCKTASGTELFVHTTSPVSGEIYLMPNMQKLAIIDEKLDVRII